MKYIFVLLATISTLACKNNTTTAMVESPTPSTSETVQSSPNDQISVTESTTNAADANLSNENTQEVPETNSTQGRVGKNESNIKVIASDNKQATKPDIKAAPVENPKNDPTPNPMSDITVDGSTTPPTTKETRPELPPKIIKDETPKEPIKQPEVKSEESLHTSFNDMLQKYVSVDGRVNYQNIKANVASLNNYLDKLSKNPPADSWSKNEKLAYWINAYNAFTIKKIIENYPLNSITDLDGGKPWDVKWIKIGDKTYSLNNIENDIIRPQFKEPRIHFAVNCAAKSCPPILNKAYTAQNLNTLLDSQTKKFINNSNFNNLDGKTIKISKIFEWYAADFGDVVTFINKYASTKVPANAKVEYMDYNWSLNK